MGVVPAGVVIDVVDVRGHRVEDVCGAGDYEVDDKAYHYAACDPG